MKAWALFLLAASSNLLLVAAPRVAFGGVPSDPVVPEPSAILVWLGLAATGGLFYWRRSRDGK